MVPFTFAFCVHWLRAARFPPAVWFTALFVAFAVCTQARTRSGWFCRSARMITHLPVTLFLFGWFAFHRFVRDSFVVTRFQTVARGLPLIGYRTFNRLPRLRFTILPLRLPFGCVFARSVTLVCTRFVFVRFDTSTAGLVCHFTFVPVTVTRTVRARLFRFRILDVLVTLRITFGSPAVYCWIRVWLARLVCRFLRVLAFHRLTPGFPRMRWTFTRVRLVGLRRLFCVILV